MLISDFNDLGSGKPIPELAVIINVGTKYVATLALLSTLRFAKIPTLLIDCESKDGSFEWFRGLMSHHDFHIMAAPLRHHGETLDWVFANAPADRILLVDSDAEMLNDAMLAKMRIMLQDSPNLYGTGYLHPAHWLERHYFGDQLIAPGIGWYMERPWIPFTLLRVQPVRTALSEGRTFMHRLVMNDVAHFPRLSRLMWKRFRFSFFRKHRLSWLDSFRDEYNAERPCYVSYDTGADLHEFMTKHQNLNFDGVSADAVPWSVAHLSGITRAALNASASDDAYKPEHAYPAVAARLRELYGLDISSAQRSAP